MAGRRQVAIIGAALDLGAGRRGVDMGPSAIRYAGLEERLDAIGYAVLDCGNVETAVPEALADSRRARALPAGDPRRLRRGSRARRRTRSREARCRSCSAATIRSRSARSAGSPRAAAPGGVIWIDAHGDLNTPETSPSSGNVHGMPLAAALGLADGRVRAATVLTLPAVDPERVALVGVRSLDARERERISVARASRVFTMSDIDRIGIERAMREALDRVAGAGFVHVSLDLDALDPEVAPGVGTPVRGGLTYREAHLALELRRRVRAARARSRSSR